MKKLIFLVVLGLGFYFWYSNKQADAPVALERHGEVIMYSLTTCGYCKLKAQELHDAGIGFTEYFIDKDAGARDELQDKLARAGFKPRTYGTPILDVNGTMLPNNPSLTKIIENL